MIVLLHWVIFRCQPLIFRGVAKTPALDDWRCSIALDIQQAQLSISHIQSTRKGGMMDSP